MATLATGACGSDQGQSGSAPTTPSTTAINGTGPADGYTPVSDVSTHAAIGRDAAEMRTLMEPAKSGGVVDWAATAKIFAEGKYSKKDGGLRTLATLAPEDAVTSLLRDAVSGAGTATGASDAIRRQKVDKAITVILERKVLGELQAAVKKTRDGKTDAATGAPHNVDEAWAFYTAEGQGPASTAAKRAADFKKEGKVHEAVLAALVEAQGAAKTGDVSKLGTAIEGAEAALDYVFYLATFKYLDTKGDPVTRAEGETFYLGIQPEVTKAAADSDKAISGAFASGQARTGRAALNSTAVLTALGITQEERISE
ncbi:MAG TPA: hypothetical protein VK988_22870 [Acidimicrobiales bacterium]|nr:hypothetical protein [Acidimicrobiales bacterium]